MAIPSGVATDMRPDAVLTGTEVAMLVDVEEELIVDVLLSLTLLLVGAVSKLVPLMVMLVPAGPTVGVKLEIVGALVDEATVKDVAEVPDPAEVVTAIAPVVAPEGTDVTIFVDVDEVTVAAVPLNVMVFWLGVVLNPVPYIVTVDPTVLLSGVNSMTATVDELWRVMESKLPVAS